MRTPHAPVQQKYRIEGAGERISGMLRVDKYVRKLLPMIHCFLSHNGGDVFQFLKKNAKDEAQNVLGVAIEHFVRGSCCHSNKDIENLLELAQS